MTLDLGTLCRLYHIEHKLSSLELHTSLLGISQGNLNLAKSLVYRLYIG